MFRGYYQCIALYIAGFLGMFVVLPPGVSAAARFTQEPPSKLYVARGGTARFVWDYHIDGGTRLDFMSPQWLFYDSTSHRIGFQDYFIGKTWRLDTANCPTRLQSPTVRVSNESNATLVIKNVTTADNGVYGCRLILHFGLQVITSKAQLIVTETPTFTVRPNPLLAINEHSDLRISCSAVGPPTPNVTWLQIQGVTKVTVTQSIGSATLNIPDIKRNQSGKVYECQAINNPNQSPVTTQTVVIVYFPPGVPNFTVSDVKASSATIRWTRPVYDGGREIAEYKIEIISARIHINASDIPHKSISGLRKNTKYGVQLYARNVAGYGSALTKFFTTTEDRTDASSTPEDAHKCATVVGVSAAFLAVSLLLNILLALYIWRNVKGPNSQSRKSTSSSYENQVEMDETSSLSTERSINPPPNHPSPEYENVPPFRVHPQHHPSLMIADYAIPENAGNRQANQDPRQYQQLNPETKTSQHGTATPVYEPLSSRPMDVNTGARDDSSERHTYEPLRNRRTESPA